MFAKINDTEIFYDVAGAGLDASSKSLKSKPVIIALNGGFGFDHGYLRLGLEDLSDDYQVIYTDMRGQGRSAKVKLSTITFEQMADDVATLMEYVGIDAGFIFGHASGSYIAQKVAMRHPEKVKGLILVASSMGMTVLPDSEEEGFETPFLKDRADNDVLATAHHFFYNAFDVTEDAFKDYSYQVGPYYLAPDNMGMCDRIRSYITYRMDLVNHFRRLNPFFNSKAKISQVETPALICAGTYDWVSPAVGSSMLAKKMPNSTFMKFTESGHFAFLEEPQKFQEALHDFIGKAE